MTSRRNRKEVTVAARAQPTLAEAIYDYFRQQVGWLPLVAFWINITFQVYLGHGAEQEDSFHGAGVALLDLLGITVFSLVFLAIAILQYFLYRKNMNRRVAIAMLAILLHGAVTLWVSAGWISLLKT